MLRFAIILALFILAPLYAENQTERQWLEELDRMVLVPKAEHRFTQFKLFNTAYAGWLTTKSQRRLELLLSPFGQYQKNPLPLREGRPDQDPIALIPAKNTPVIVNETPPTELLKVLTTDLARENRQFWPGRRPPLLDTHFHIDAQLIALWLHRRGKTDDAVRILQLARKKLSVENPQEVLRKRIAMVVGQQMMDRFVRTDYSHVLDIASHIQKRLPGSPYHSIATRLIAELPKRTIDYGKLRLPPPQHWKFFLTKYSREQQLQYLAYRIRLIRGRADLVAPAQIPQARGGEINPYVELLRLNLKVKDIPTLAPFLKNDWMLPVVVEFDPLRVVTTRPILAGLINHIAEHQLVRLDALAKNTEAHVAIVGEWAKRFADQPQSARLLDGLERGLQHKLPWRDLEPVAKKLVQLNEPRIGSLLLRCLDLHLSSIDATTIANLARQQDRAMVLGHLEKSLADPQLDRRASAGIILIGLGEIRAATPVLSKAIDEMNLKAPRFIAAMSALGAHDVAAIRRLCLNRKRLLSVDALTRTAVLREAASLKVPEAYGFYRKLLKIEEMSVEGVDFGRPVAQVMAEEVIDLFGRNDFELYKASAAESPKELIEAVDAWLQKKM